MKKILITLTTTLFVTVASAQVSLTINVPTAGGLSTAITSAGGNATTITNLTITGNIDARDVKFIRDSMPVLAVLDLGTVQIIGYTGTDGTSPYTTTYPANTFPYCAFYNQPLAKSKTTLKSIKLPKSIISIGYNAFYKCTGLTGSLTIPYPVTGIGNLAYYGCTGLTGSIILPNAVLGIGEDAFNGCTGFNGVLYIPALVINMETWTFGGCTRIQKILVNKSTPFAYVEYTLGGINKATPLVVPMGSKATYQATAVWNQFTNITEAIFVVLDTQGGNPVLPITTTLTNAIIAEPGNPVRDGYTFSGWYMEAACINAWNFATDIVTAPVTLYAKWTINPVNTFTVNFNVIGGSAVPDIVANSNTTVSAPTAPTKTGYTFAGWYKEATYTNAWSFTSDIVTSNIMLYAKWTINTYTVSFNVDGGTIVADLNANYNTTIAAPKAPAKTGYTFAGWYKEAGYINAWNFATDFVIANITLYAKWTSTTGIESKQAADFKLYPNPANDKLYIKHDKPSNTLVIIFDLQGKQVINTRLSSNYIDISNLSKGIYLVKSVDSGIILVDKFVKE